jgi:CubicO group peptidase (beta-lactamase class C family)
MQRVSARQLAEWAAEARERWNVPGIAIGFLQDGELVSAADGICELGRREQVSSETVFRVASLTKPFTATLVLTLVQDGLLALDEPPAGTRVDATVRELLSHQGGLACEWPQPLDEAGCGDDALLRLAEGEPEQLPVGRGELFSYCNVGYRLVGAAIARILGMSFEEAMLTRVIGPLGLQSTGFEADSTARGHNQVTPGTDDHAPADAAYPRVRWPSGGLWSTVGDLLRFAAHHLGEPGPLTLASIAEMQRPQIGLAGGSYGLGWFLTDTRRRPVVEHPGSVCGFQSHLLLVPREKLAVAALSNSSRGSAAIRNVLESLGLGSAPVPSAALRRDQLAALTGRYQAQELGIEIAAEEGLLSIAITELDLSTGETQFFPRAHARPVTELEFEIVDGEWRSERLDFPREGFVRCLGRVAARAE